MNFPTREELKLKFESAPQFVRDYITSDELAKIFEELRTTHKIHLDEAEKISIALNAVFLEIKQGTEFPDLLKAALTQNGDKYQMLLTEINEKIFKAFRAKMEQGGSVNQKPNKKIADEVKPTAVAKAPVLQPEVPAVPTSSRSPLERLQQTTSQSAEPTPALSVHEKKQEEKQQESAAPTYSGSDPYREPIE